MLTHVALSDPAALATTFVTHATGADPETCQRLHADLVLITTVHTPLAPLVTRFQDREDVIGPLAKVLGEISGQQLAILTETYVRPADENLIGGALQVTETERSLQEEFGGRLSPEVIQSAIQRLPRRDGGVHSKLRACLEKLAQWSHYLRVTLPVYMTGHSDRVSEVHDTLMLQVARGERRRPRAESQATPWELLDAIREILNIPAEPDMERFGDAMVSLCQDSCLDVPPEIIQKVAEEVTSMSEGADIGWAISVIRTTCERWQQRAAALIAELEARCSIPRKDLRVACQEAMIRYANHAGVYAHRTRGTGVLKPLRDQCADILREQSPAAAAPLLRSVLMEELKKAHPKAQEEFLAVIGNYCMAKLIPTKGMRECRHAAFQLCHRWQTVPRELSLAARIAVPDQDDRRETLLAEAWSWLAENPAWMDEQIASPWKNRLSLLVRRLLDGERDTMSGQDRHEWIIKQLQARHPGLPKELIPIIVDHSAGLPVVRRRPAMITTAAGTVLRHLEELAHQLGIILKCVLPTLSEPVAVRDEALTRLVERFSRHSGLMTIRTLCDLAAPIAFAALQADGAGGSAVQLQELTRAFRIEASSEKWKKKLDIPMPIIDAAARVVEQSRCSYPSAFSTAIKKLGQRWHEWLQTALANQPEELRTQAQERCLTRLAALDIDRLDTLRKQGRFEAFVGECLGQNPS